MGFFDHLFSFFRRKSLPEHIEDQLEERRLRPRVNPKEGTRVLVIDDSPTILTAMKRFLESAHCVFLGALDAKMGMEVALTQKPDLIFLDIVMPGINGFAALRAMRKNARTRETPIIMMSGNEQAKAQFFGAHIGADDFMKKPFSRFEVFARIARLLDTDRIPRRPPAHSASSQNVMSPEAPSEEVASQQETPQEQPQQVEAEQPPAPSSFPPSRKSARSRIRSRLIPSAPDESISPVLTSDQIVAPPSPEPPQLVEQPPEPPIHADPVVEEAPVIPHQTEVSPVSAQVVPLTQPSAPAPGVSPELLTRIARLAQLAQSDPEALKALVVLSAQLAAQYTAAAGASQETAARAAAT
ncbi:MAG: response regulator [Azoarcus sp.]|nr:response regulator [Azoarcus sp.]